MQYNKRKPIIMLIGQSGAGKSKFISEFLHEKVKGFLPKRRDGQTTKCITVYELKHNLDKTIEYTINFANEEVVKDIFEQRLINAMKSISIYEKDDQSIPDMLEEDRLNDNKLLNLSKFDNSEEEKKEFLNSLYDDKDKLLDLIALIKVNPKININDVSNSIYIKCKQGQRDNVVEYMIENLYRNVIESFFKIKYDECSCKSKIDLDKFSKKDVKIIDRLEPLIKSVEYSIPCSFEYSHLLFNENNEGIIFLDTVGTDHTGEDNLETIFGMYNYSTDYKYKPDIITFINDINKFREREKAIRSIFTQIINDNNLSRFMLVNTKIDKRLTDSTFQEIKDEYEDGEDIRSYHKSEFREYEDKVIQDVNRILFKGLEKSIEEYLVNKNIEPDLKDNIIKKIKIRCESNSIYLSNPETDSRYNTEIMNEIDVKILREISAYNFKNQINQYIRKIYENYEIINNTNVVYIQQKNRNGTLLSFISNNKIENFVDEIVLEFIHKYEKLRYNHYNSMRALSNGFNRKQFTADTSYYTKSFPNIEFFNTIKEFIKSKSFTDFIKKNYEVDFSKINRDNLIFEDKDPIIYEKLISKLYYEDFNKLIWREIIKKLIELNQFYFTKRIDTIWERYSDNKIEEIFKNYYIQKNLIDVIENFEFDHNRWNFMGNVIGYQFKCIFTANKDFFNKKIIEFIECAFNKVNQLLDREIIAVNDQQEVAVELEEKKDNIINCVASIDENEEDKKEYKRMSDNGVKKIFISHCQKDESVVRRLIKFLGDIGVPRDKEHIFCSSYTGLGVIVGEKISEYIKNEFDDDIIVLFIFTENYFKSAPCLCEMGATWIKTKEHIPIIIPPFEFEGIKGFIDRDVKGINIINSSDLYELKKKIESIYDIEPNWDNWETDRDDFIDLVKNIINNTN